MKAKQLNIGLIFDSPAKPFLKWAGGKGQLLDKFLEFYPAELKNGSITNYYEPFIGGGAVFFDLAQRFNIKSAFLSDINQELILTYRVIQRDVFKLIETLNSIKWNYENSDETVRREFYYELRNKFNQVRSKIDYSKYSEDWIPRAAQTIFMNKTCFNGLFRFNQKGEFNVPAGRYKNPKILDENNLIKLSKLLEIAEIRNVDFETVENIIKEKSFVYFDPPYRPISKSSSFTGYSNSKFGDDEQRQLSALFHRLHQKGAKLMLSNSDPKNIDPTDNFFDEMYKEFYVSRVSARRMINSDATKRDAINEIVVTNYPTN